MKREINRIKKLPVHVAIIMDGNGRWAKARGLPRVFGHRQGLLRVKEILVAASDMGIKYSSVYAFSSENWKRSDKEVDFLMKACRAFLQKELKLLMDREVRFKHIGRLDELPKSVQEVIWETEKITKNNKRHCVQLAFNYGSRTEIVDAIKKISEDYKLKKISLKDITNDLVSSYLYTAGVPDPDLLIRTSGEMRVSNFLLWQIAYSELYVTKKLWPDFSKHDFLKAIEAFQDRSRRFGGING